MDQTLRPDHATSFHMVVPSAVSGPGGGVQNIQMYTAFHHERRVTTTHNARASTHVQVGCEFSEQEEEGRGGGGGGGGGERRRGVGTAIKGAAKGAAKFVSHVFGALFTTPLEGRRGGGQRR